MARRFAMGALALALTGCPEVEGVRVVVDLDARTITTTYEGLRTGSLWNGRGDLVSVVEIVADLGKAGARDLADFNPLMPEVPDDLEPGLTFVSAELKPEGGRLDGVVVMAFEDLADLGLVQHKRRRPILWCGEGLTETNGTRLHAFADCVVWDRKAERLEVTLRDRDLEPGYGSLLPYYRQWQDAGSPEDWPTEHPGRVAFREAHCTASDLYGALMGSEARRLEVDADGDGVSDRIAIRGDGVLSLELSREGTFSLAPGDEGTALLARYRLPRRLPAGALAVARRAIAPRACRQPDPSLAALLESDAVAWVDGPSFPPDDYVLERGGELIVYSGSAHGIGWETEVRRLESGIGGVSLYGTEYGVVAERAGRHAWLLVTPAAIDVHRVRATGEGTLALGIRHEVERPWVERQVALD